MNAAPCLLQMILSLLVVFVFAQDGRCGPQFGNTQCANGNCCSTYGWCGESTDHCAAPGCASQCTSGSPGPSNLPSETSVDSPPNISTRPDGRCGPQFGNAQCDGGCCSAYGWCGTSPGHCAAPGCASQCTSGTPSPSPSGTSIPSGTPPPSSNNWPLQTSPATSCIQPKTVALSFDDGPQTGLTEQVIAAAKLQNVPVTFFEIGANVQANPEISAAVNNNGFVIGDHTQTHPSAIGLSDEQIGQEANLAANAIQSATGRNPRFLRPPYGDYTASALSVWYNLGYYVVTWSIDSNDWRDPTNTAAALNNIQTQLAADTNSGHIVLCHDFAQACINGFSEIVQLFKNNGYTFVTMEQCLGIAPYK